MRVQRGPACAARPGAATAAILVTLAFVGCGGDAESETDTSAGIGDTAAAGSSPGSDSDLSSPTKPKTVPEPEGPEAGLAPEAQVDLAIKGVLASAVPQLACRRYATQRYVKKAFGDRQGCLKSTVPASAAAYVKVTRVDIDGSKATARALPSGGPSDGEKIDVTLVRQGGIWQVDLLRSNVPVGP
jgi:hypothetical protein